MTKRYFRYTILMGRETASEVEEFNDSEFEGMDEDDINAYVSDAMWDNTISHNVDGFSEEISKAEFERI